MNTPAVPDAVGTVRAYRTWDVTGSAELRSVTRDWYWGPGVNRAACPAAATLEQVAAHRARVFGQATVFSHHIPDIDCACGLYASRDPGSRAIRDTEGRCFGVVELQGGIVFHEDNHVVRAERAVITAICLPRRWFHRKVISAITARYPGVAVYHSRRALLASYPPDPGITVTRPSPGQRRRRGRQLASSACQAALGWGLPAGITAHGVAAGQLWYALYGAALLSLNTAFLLRSQFRALFRKLARKNQP